MSQFRAAWGAVVLAAIVAGHARANGGVVETIGPGRADWTRGMLMVTGSGVPPAGKTGAQARLMAERAAQVEAYRQLAEVVSGVQITSETTVKDFVAESDVIKTQVSATIKGAKRTGPPRKTPDGAVEIDLEMPVYGNGGLADAVDLDAVIDKVQAMVPAPWVRRWLLATASVNGWEGPFRVANATYTGVIIDATALNPRPALAPIVRDAQKRPLYPSANLKIDKQAVVARGLAKYEATLDAAKADAARIGASPLILKAHAVEGKGKSDLVLDAAAADALLAAEKAQPFLGELKVAILTNASAS